MFLFFSYEEVAPVLAILLIIIIVVTVFIDKLEEKIYYAKGSLHRAKFINLFAIRIVRYETDEIIDFAQLVRERMTTKLEAEGVYDSLSEEEVEQKIEAAMPALIKKSDETFDLFDYTLKKIKGKYFFYRPAGLRIKFVRKSYKLTKGEIIKMP